MDKESALKLIITILTSGAFFSLIQFLITRWDSKKHGVEKKIDEVSKNIENVSNNVNEISNRLEEHKATLARTHILRFADELRNGTKHSDEYFRQQILDIDTYEHYCELHPEFANGLTKMASKYIKEEAWNHYRIPANHDKE